MNCLGQYLVSNILVRKGILRQPNPTLPTRWSPLLQSTLNVGVAITKEEDHRESRFRFSLGN